MKLFRVPKGYRAPGLRPKTSGAPGLQGKNIGAPGLHNISFGAQGFTVIKYSGLQVSKFSGLRAPQQKFGGFKAPGTPSPLWDPDYSSDYSPFNNLGHLAFCQSWLARKTSLFVCLSVCKWNMPFRGDGSTSTSEWYILKMPCVILKELKRLV